MLSLTKPEKAWLDAYRAVLDSDFPGLVENLIVFGSKARGTSTPDSDLDILVIIGQGDWRQKDAITRPGYMLSIGTHVVPSFLVYTRREWAAVFAREQDQRIVADSCETQLSVNTGVTLFFWVPTARRHSFGRHHGLANLLHSRRKTLRTRAGVDVH